MTSALNRREFTFSGSAAAFSIAVCPLRAAPVTLDQPAGSPVAVQIIGGDLTARERQDMIAQITGLLAEVLQLPDRSLVTVLSMTSAEQFVSAERQHDVA
jgi:hypothetical protein